VPDTKLELLIRNHFPWGQTGFAARPADASPGALAASVHDWMSRQLADLGFENTALALHARIQSVIDEVEQALPPSEKHRLFYRSDLGHLVKSSESILDKMVRDWNPENGRPRLSFDNFLDEMEDLARFRIVLNFLSDVKAVCSRLEEPYNCSPEELARLSDAQHALYGDFALRGHRMRDLILLGPEKRDSGERCFKGIFYRRANTRMRVEVQIQTMFQEAWDKKDHFLMYEPKRRGEAVELSHRIEIYAISELLYVADLTFDRLLSILRERRARGAE